MAWTTLGGEGCGRAEICTCDVERQQLRKTCTQEDEGVARAHVVYDNQQIYSKTSRSTMA